MTPRLNLFGAYANAVVARIWTGPLQGGLEDSLMDSEIGASPVAIPRLIPTNLAAGRAFLRR
jgi:hypothetical protein